MELSDITDILTSNYIPEATLALGGILAVIISMMYMKDRDSASYKVFMFIGVLVGIYMAFMTYSTYGLTGWAMSTYVIMMVAAFTLVIRPFKEVHFAILIALMTMGVAYILLASLQGTMLEILSEGWYRIGVALVCGAIVYSLLHMVESIVKLIGRVMNAWPILFILGLLCIAEAAMVFMGYGSVYDFLTS